jgi:hypothetical protein
MKTGNRQFTGRFPLGEMPGSFLPSKKRRAAQ